MSRLANSHNLEELKDPEKIRFLIKPKETTSRTSEKDRNEAHESKCIFSANIQKFGKFYNATQAISKTDFFICNNAPSNPATKKFCESEQPTYPIFGRVMLACATLDEIREKNICPSQQDETLYDASQLTGEANSELST